MFFNKFFIFIHKFSYKLYNIYAWYISKIVKKCGTKLKIWGNVVLKNPENIEFGNSVALNDGVYINAYASVKIGNNVAISAGAMLITTGLDISTFTDKMLHYGKPIILENNIQVGAGAIILPGVKIGSNVIIGAGSVVTKDVVNNAVVAGVPAKIIRRITDSKKGNL
ncbi:acyltransferase [Patescibacteria group bacterium]|nr:acyltransferase [Patescibacteria group bacterium]